MYEVLGNLSVTLRASGLDHHMNDGASREERTLTRETDVEEKMIPSV